jgi:LuxR family transcriptional regulator, maltose regulon positive regulatory protein
VVTQDRPGTSSARPALKPDKFTDVPGGRLDGRTHVPSPVAHQVLRPSLDALIDTCSQHRLTIVSAGPGWGKTTAVASWARRASPAGARATAWLTLGPSDNTPVTFWEGVLRAIERSGVVSDDHPLASVSTAAGVSEGVLLALFRGLLELPKPLLLILDDFHVIEDPAILDAVAQLVTHPAPVTLMLLTRRDPALPLHRLRLSGDLGEVRAADLAFDVDAVKSLVGRTESLHLAPAEVGMVLARTEGWPAGVRLATMYLAREGDDATLEHFGGTERSVAEYLLAEVLARYDPKMTDFLLRTSVVEWLTGDLADALAPDAHGLTRLEMLEQNDSFVTCVDRSLLVYRVHPLLRDLLVHRLRRDDAAGYREANRVAARWLDGANEPVEAIAHAVEAEDWHLAGEVFLNAAPLIITAHRFRLAQHLQAIPYAKLPPSAALELCAGGAALIARRYDTLVAHVESARRLVQDGEVLPPLGLALIEVFAAVAARETGDPRQVMEAATATLTHLANSPASPAGESLRPIAVHQRTVGYMMVTGDTASAIDMFSAVADAQHGETTLISFNARVYRTWCLALAGRLDESEKVVRELLREAAVLGWTSSVHALPAHLTLAMIHLVRAEEPEAYRAAMAGLAATAGVTELWPTVALHLTRASTAVARGRPRAAHASFENARALRGSRPVPGALADMWLRTQVDVTLLAEGDAAIPPLEAESDARSATWWSSSARVALARSDLETAETTADAALRVLRYEEPPQDLDDVLAAIEAHLVRAVVADRRRRPQESSVCMRTALQHALSQRFLHPLLATDPGRTAVILQRALADGVVPADDLVQTVLARLSPQAVPSHEPDPLIDPLTERELAVLAELPTWKSNAEIAAEFYVSVNTVKSHLQHLFRKLDVANRRQAVRRGRDLGLIS